MDIITTENMHEYSEQQVFDYVVEQLYKQGVPCVENGTDRCMYRGPNGLKCAAGILIPDEIYNKEWDSKDGKTYDMLVEESLVPETHRELISELQIAHDDWAMGSDFLQEFKKAARNCNLQFNASNYENV